MYDQTHKAVRKDGTEVTVGDTVVSLRGVQWIFRGITRVSGDGPATEDKVLVADPDEDPENLRGQREYYRSVFDLQIVPRGPDADAQHAQLVAEYGEPVTDGLLNSNGPKDVSQAVQLVFGHIAQLAVSVVRGYFSDLYYDALWLHRQCTGEGFYFWYAVGVNGTHIGTDEAVMTGRAMRTGHKIYRINVGYDSKGRLVLHRWEVRSLPSNRQS